MKVKVLIDGHMLGTNEGGNERYTTNLFLNLLDREQIDTKILVNGKYYNKAPRAIKEHCILQNVDNDIYRLARFIPNQTKYQNINIVHSNYILPFVKNAKFIVTVHDFYFKHRPDFYTWKENIIFHFLLPRSLANSDAIIVPSNYIKKEATKFYPQYQKKIFITHYGVNRDFCSLERNLAKKILYKKLNICPPFILTINSKHPKKNINRIIKAFLKLQNNFPNLKLVIVGGGYNIDDRLKKAKQLIILNYITDEDLNVLYNCCQVFIYYSLYEGFGLPIFEALKSGAYIIASDIEVHREIYGDAILYSDPLDEEDLYYKLKNALTKNDYTETKKREGLRLIKKYSWEKTARLTAEVYRFVNNTK